MPKGVPIFQAFLLGNAVGNFYTLLLFKKLCIILEVVVIHIYMCIVLTIVLYFISIFLYLKKSMWNFSLLQLFPFCSLVRNENIKRPGFYTLQITRVFSNFPQLKQLNKIRIRVKIVIFLNCDLPE